MQQSQIPKIGLVTQWQCSVSNLSSQLYSRFQHASLYNPIKNSSFSISKVKESSFAHTRYLSKGKSFKNDYLFKRGNSQYRLPIVQSFYRNRKQKDDNQKQNWDKKDSVVKSSAGSKNGFQAKTGIRIGSTGTSTPWMSRETGRATHNIKPKPLNQSGATTRRTVYIDLDWNKELQYFKQQMCCNSKLSQKDKYFSYYYLIVQQISNMLAQSSQKSQLLQTIQQDMQLLLGTIDHKKSVISTLKNTLQFKNENKYFQFKNPQIRILFHLLLAELQYYEGKDERTILEFEFCQYFCRKEGLENLTICFLWEIASIYANALKFQEADYCLRNLIQMVIVCKKKKAIKFIFEKISVLYYYRGNSIMGHYYLEKSETGLTMFQSDIYSRQYSKNDEIKRLEHKLFKLPIQQQIVKRKHNPKFQYDIWKQSKYEHEKRVDSYMHTVNQMLKDHEHTKLGQKIKMISHQLNQVGNCKKKHNLNKSMPRFTHFPKKNHELIRNSQNQQKKQNLNQPQPLQPPSTKAPLHRQVTQQNITKVIKTHLSLNRDNNCINREHRWKKFINFVISLDRHIRGIGKDRKENSKMQTNRNGGSRIENRKTMPKIGASSNSSSLTASTVNKKGTDTY